MVRISLACENQKPHHDAVFENFGRTKTIGERSTASSEEGPTDFFDAIRYPHSHDLESLYEGVPDLSK